MNTSIRELLGVRLTREGQGLPAGLQIVGFAVYLAFVVAFAWAGNAAAPEPYGLVAGLGLGVFAGTYVSTTFFRGQRARHQARE